MERTKTEIDSSLLEAVRKLAAEEGRDERELLEHAVRRYLLEASSILGREGARRGGPPAEDVTDRELLETVTAECLERWEGEPSGKPRGTPRQRRPKVEGAPASKAIIEGRG